MDNIREQRRLFEANATLLRSIHKFPGDQCTSDKPQDDRNHQISVTLERRLADDFAFLASTTDDPYKIAAVALEEDGDGQGITIRIATNTGDLDRIKEGFEGIGQVLEQAASTNATPELLEATLCSRVVALDRDRLLSRIRSRHNPDSIKARRRPTKQSVVKHLEKAMATARASIVPVQVDSADFSKAEVIVSNIGSIFEELESLPIGIPASESLMLNEFLEAIIVEFGALSEKLDLMRSIWSQTRPRLDPCLLLGLVDKVSKIGKYYLLTQELISVARSNQNDLFRRVTVGVVYDSDVLSSLPLLPTPFEEVCQHVRLPELDEGKKDELKKDYEKRIAYLDQNLKVHAEMKLIIFYLQRSGLISPRIIASSKSACYLCHLFISTHGSFSTVRTHGTLYDGWVLPKISSTLTRSMGLYRVLKLCNEKLEADIRLLLARPKKKVGQPNESVVSLHRVPLASALTQMPSTQAEPQPIPHKQKTTQVREACRGFLHGVRLISIRLFKQMSWD